MKKIVWSLIILLILLGLLTLWVITSQRRLNVKTGQLNRLTHQTVTVPTAPHTVRLTLRTAHLVIQPGSRYQLSMDNIINNQFEINNSNRHFNLTEAHANHHQFEIGKTPVITLTVPQNLQQLAITQLNGTLVLNRLTVGTLDVNHSNGTTTATDLTLLHGGQLAKKNGRTDLRRLTSDGLKVSVKTGQLQLNGAKRASSHQSYTKPGDAPLTIRSGSGQVQVTTAPESLTATGGGR